jgi:lantibiotic leader peptide-processing serine protease
MRRKLLGIVAALAASLLAAAAMGADAAPQSAARALLAPTGAEYIVAYDGANAGAAEQAITAAGGTVVDRNDAIDLVLVNTDNAAFAYQVRSGQGVTGVALNHSIGTARQNMPHRFAEERPEFAVAGRSSAGSGHKGGGKHGQRTDPLASLQWDMAMIGATSDGAHRRATGQGVTVGVIDTGVDASHPDIAPNFSHALSRNFVVDRPDIDGPCDTPTCVDPADVDQGGHGTHVAGIIAAARNGIGITGVAPDATIVNVRAGQDSGYFFVWETVQALVYAGDAGLDVANMSFYTDPWLFNCESAADYVSGTVTAEQLAEQATIRRVVLAATSYAHNHGVTLVAAAGNDNTNYSLPTRFDPTSPDYPPGTEADRVVTSNCLDLPSEAPDVISVSSVGPSGIKSDFSNYGLGSVEVSAPGGWFRDGVGTPTFRTPGNEILSSYPLELGIEEGLFDATTQQPTDDSSVADCSVSPCGFYTYLQGTSMASTHAAGVAALIVEAHGQGDRRHGYSLAPDKVGSILMRSATDHACPAGGSEIYTDEGRPPEFDAVCDGTTANNGLYGEGIVNAIAAVGRR